MNFYTTTSFRISVSKLTRKPKDGYNSVVEDICEALKKMDDNILRETNDRIRQEKNFRIVKLRVNNSAQNLPKNDAFRLIYWVSMVTDNCVLLSVYPKRGPLAANNLTKNEFIRLLVEMVDENEKSILQKADILNNLNVIEEGCSW